MIRKIALACISLFALLVFWYSSASADSPIWMDTLDLSGNANDQSFAVDISDDGKRLVASSTSGVYLFQLPNKKLLSVSAVTSWPYDVAFIPNTHQVLAVTLDGNVVLMDGDGIGTLETLKITDSWIRTLDLTIDGTTFVTASDDDVIRIFAASNLGLLSEIKVNGEGLRAAAISGDGRLVAGALRDNSIKVWDASTGIQLYTLLGHTDWPRKMSFSPDGKLLFTGGFDKNMIVWNMDDGSQKNILSGHTSSILSLTISSDGEIIASGSVDDTIRLWDRKTRTATALISPECGFIYSVAFSPDGSTLAAACERGQVKLVSLNDMPAQNADELIGPTVSSDCRTCHHLQKTGEPVRVTQMSCTVCHDSGANLSWCPIFPRAVDAPSNFKMSVRQVLSGLSIGNRGGILRITTPSNGESYYSSNMYVVPGFIYGTVTDGTDQVEDGMVRITVTNSDGATWTDQTPIVDGVFSFLFRLNKGERSSGLNLNHSVDCLTCHKLPVDTIALVSGTYTVVAETTLSNDRLISDRRVFKVDIPEVIELPVRLIDGQTDKYLSGATVVAEAVHLGWRSKISSAVTDDDGRAILLIDKLPENENNYTISMESEKIEGQLYQSANEVELTLTGSEEVINPVVLIARPATGIIEGIVLNVDQQKPILSGIVSAFKRPYGGIYTAEIMAEGKFSFTDMPTGEYYLCARSNIGETCDFSQVLASADVENGITTVVNLLLDSEQIFSGEIIDEQNRGLPFAWARTDDNSIVIANDPMTGEFNLPLNTNTTYASVSAPGYYTRSELVTTTTDVTIKLQEKNDLRIVDGEFGAIYIPAESSVNQQEDGYFFENGWLWGWDVPGGSGLIIRTQTAIIQIESGDFAISKTDNNTAWLSTRGGSATISFNTGEQKTLKAGEILAISPEAMPIPYTMELDRILRSSQVVPVREQTSPEVSDLVREIAIKTGITTIRLLTLLTYIAALVFLAIFPVIFFKARKRLKER